MPILSPSMSLSCYIIVATALFRNFCPGAFVSASFGECPAGTSFTSIADDTDVREVSNDMADKTQEVDLPFDFPWISGVDINNIGVSTNGVITVPYTGPYLAYFALPIEKGGDIFCETTPRISVAHEDLDPRSGGGVYVKEATNEVTISWEGVPFYFWSDDPSDSDGGIVNAQVTLHDTGSITFCYGNGNLESGDSFAAGLEDDTVDRAYPMPLAEFDAQGITKTFPSGKCACFFQDSDEDGVTIIQNLLNHDLNEEV